MFECEFSVKRTLSGVSGVQWACLAFQLHGAVARHARRERKRHCALGGNIVCHQVYVLVNAFLPGGMTAAVTHPHGSTSNLKLIDGYVRGGFP